MSASMKEHAAFWKRLAGSVGGGTPLLEALAEAGKAVEDTPLAPAAEAIARDMAAGVDFSVAVEKHASLFGRVAVTMVRAGEAAGAVDVMLRRMAEGVADGSFPLPGAPPRPEGEAARWWRAFARMLSSGIPILQCFEALSDGVGDVKLREALDAVARAIMEGESGSSAMARSPDVFPAEVVGALRWGEEKGHLDEVAAKIAEALESGDLGGLPAVPAGVPAGEPGEAIVKADDTSPVVKIVNETILEAIRSRATDVHIEPADAGGGRVRYRIDGALRDVREIPKDRYAAVMSRVKIMAALDIAERRCPQDGKMRIVVGGKAFDLRVCVVPTVRGESVVLRILASEGVVRSLDSFGFGEEELGKLRGLSKLPYGLVIASGPTGSGKSTLLYAMVNEIDRERNCVISVEDPVEYRLEGVRQTQLNARAGLTYPHLLRSALRQDPDVIIVGELRDLETAEIAHRAALTGHLVLTVMHTATATATARRLLDLGLEPFQLNAALAGVVSQRLVRKLCPECRAEAVVSEDAMPKEAVDFIRSPEGGKVFDAGGCGKCRGGYKGRIAIHEILTPDDEFRKAVARSADEETLREIAVGSGMKTLFQCGMENALAGKTSVAEVCRVAWYCR